MSSASGLVLADDTVENRWRAVMGIISWVVLGGIAGWIASLIVNKTGEGLFLDIVLGIIGGIVGGWIFTAFGSTGMTGFNLWSLLVAIVGALCVLLIYHLLIGRTSRT